MTRKRSNPQRAQNSNPQRALLRKEWREIQVSSKNYVDDKLGESERNGFFAAGICPFSTSRNPKTGKDELSVLLVKERRKSSIRFNFLGGKREIGETPDQTAYREFLEETGNVLSKEQKESLSLQLQAKHNHVMWLSQGRYILIGISSPKEWLKLPEKFKKWWSEKTSKTAEEKSLSSNPMNCKMKSYGLVWVPMKKLTSTKIKEQLSRFLQSICKCAQFEEFLNTFGENTEHVDIIKHFRLNPWKSSVVRKRGRDVIVYHRPPKRVTI